MPQLLARTGRRLRRWRSGLIGGACLMLSGCNATLLRRLREIAPTLKAIVMTGGLTREEVARAVESESAAFLIKPFEAHALLETLRRTLDS